MSKSDTLYSLIRSLTSSEKRYFKMVTGLQGHEQNYLALFDAIDKMEDYDEALITEQFSDRPFIKQLHVAKNYLSKLIMSSLRGYHLNDSISARLKARLVDIELLFKKDLLKQCYSTVCRTEKLAEKVGDEVARLEVLSWKRKILLNMTGVVDNRFTLHEIAIQEQATLNALADEGKLWDLTLEISSLNGQSTENYLGHPLLAKTSPTQTYRSKILYYHLRYVTHTMSNQLDKAEESLDSLIGFLEHEPYKLRHDPAPYITALNNKIGLYLNQRKHELVPPLLDKIRDIPRQFKLKSRSPISMKLLLRTYNIELETYRDSGQTGRALALIPKVKSFMHANDEFISREYQILLHYQFAYLNFIGGDFRTSLADVNHVLSHRNYQERSDIIGYAQFLNLIIHYELGNSTVMKYSVDASRRYLRKHRVLQEFEKVLLRLFSTLSTRPESHHHAILEKCYQQLFGTPPLLSESQLDYLDFKYWFSSKLKINI